MQLTVLYIALYMTALGTGGLKSSVSGLGSDQFDESDKEERIQMTNFFNWFFFFISIGSLAAVTVLVYIQDNMGREWGYGICACAIVLGLLVFLSGTRLYRFKKLVGSPLTQIATVFVAAWKKRRLELPSDSALLYNVDDIADGHKKKKQMLPHTTQFRLVLLHNLFHYLNFPFFFLLRKTKQKQMTWVFSTAWNSIIFLLVYILLDF